MATEKVTIMVLKVDLQCSSCYKKTKKTLCKFPQVHDQIYDEKNNTVTISVVCCSPEKIRDKLCCKGGKAIKSIEIKESGKPKEPEKKKESEKPKQPEKPKEAEKPKEKEKPKGPEKPKVTIIEPNLGQKPKDAGKPKEMEKPKPDGKGDKPKSNGGPPPAEKPVEKPKEAPKAEPAKNNGGPGPGPGPAMIPFPAQPVMKGPEPVPANGVPSVFPYVGPTYDGYGAGPCYHGYGFPAPPPQPCYEGYYGHGHAHGYGYGHDYGRVAHVNRCDNYYSEEESQGCTIM